MRKRVKGLIKVVIIVVGILCMIYGAYRLYNYLLEHAIQEITQKVRKEVKESMNPLKWPGKIF